MTYDTLIQNIYECALHPEQWAGTLQRIRHTLSASAYSLFALDANPLDPPTLYSENLSETWTHAYRDYWWQHDSWFLSAAQRNLVQGGMTLAGSSLVDRRILRNSHWYNDGIVKQDIGDVLSTGLWNAPDEAPKCILSFYRTPQAEPFQAHDQQMLGRLNQHLTRSLALTRQSSLRLHNQTIQQSLLDGLDHPVLLLDGGGKILRGNPAAQKLPKQEPHLLRIQQGRLTGLGDRCNPGIQQALAQVRHAPLVHLAMTYLRASGLTGSASARLMASPNIGHVLIIQPGDCERPGALRAFGTLYQLTQAEQNVLSALLQDESPDAIASRLQISISTVRTHLQSLRQKTGTRRLSTLMRLAQQAIR